MSIELHQNADEVHPYDVVDGVEDVLVEAIWHELDRQLPRARVRCVVAEVALGFRNATVKTFVPIFVRQQALERLRRELDELTPTDDRLLNEYK